MTVGGRRDPGVGGTLRGALLIVALGVALGVVYNALGQAGRPPRGVAWIGASRALPDLEPRRAAADPPPAHPAPAGAAIAEPAAPGDSPDASPPARPRRGADRPATAAPPPAAAAPPPAAARSAPPPVIPDADSPYRVELALVKQLVDANAALVIDARDRDEYEQGHIAGAINLPYNDALADPERVKKLDPGGRPAVVYCSGGSCELSADLAGVLVRAGWRKVLVYEGGYPEWQAAGYPIARGAAAGTAR